MAGDKGGRYSRVPSMDSTESQDINSPLHESTLSSSFQKLSDYVAKYDDFHGLILRLKMQLETLEAEFFSEAKKRDADIYQLTANFKAATREAITTVYKEFAVEPHGLEEITSVLKLYANRLNLLPKTRPDHTNFLVIFYMPALNRALDKMQEIRANNPGWEIGDVTKDLSACIRDYFKEIQEPNADVTKINEQYRTRFKNIQTQYTLPPLPEGDRLHPEKQKYRADYSYWLNLGMGQIFDNLLQKTSVDKIKNECLDAFEKALSADRKALIERSEIIQGMHETFKKTLKSMSELEASYKKQSTDDRKKLCDSNFRQLKTIIDSCSRQPEFISVVEPVVMELFADITIDRLHALDDDMFEEMKAASPDKRKAIGKVYIDKLKAIRDAYPGRKTDPEYKARVEPVIKKMAKAYEAGHEAFAFEETHQKQETSASMTRDIFQQPEEDTMSHSSTTKSRENSRSGLLRDKSSSSVASSSDRSKRSRITGASFTSGRSSHTRRVNQQKSRITTQEALKVLHLGHLSVSSGISPKTITEAYNNLYDKYTPPHGNDRLGLQPKLYGAKQHLLTLHKAWVKPYAENFADKLQAFNAEFVNANNAKSKIDAQVEALKTLGQTYLEELKKDNADPKGLTDAYYTAYRQQIEDAETLLSSVSIEVRPDLLKSLASLYVDIYDKTVVAKLHIEPTEIDPIPIVAFQEKYQAYVDYIHELKEDYPHHQEDFETLIFGLEVLGKNYYTWLEQEAAKATGGAEGLYDIPLSYQSGGMSHEQFQERFQTLVTQAKEAFSKTPSVWESLSPCCQKIATCMFIPFALIKLYDAMKAYSNSLFKPEPFNILERWQQWQLDTMPKYEGPNQQPKGR